MDMFQEHSETLSGICGLRILWEYSFKPMKVIYIATTRTSYKMSFRNNVYDHEGVIEARSFSSCI